MSHEQLRLFDDGHEPKSDKLYDLLLDELRKDMDEAAAHLAALDISKRIRDEKMYCECSGNCSCSK